MNTTKHRPKLSKKSYTFLDGYPTPTGELGHVCYVAATRATNAWDTAGAGMTYRLRAIAWYRGRGGGLEWRPSKIIKALNEATNEVRP